MILEKVQIFKQCNSITFVKKWPDPDLTIKAHYVHTKPTNHTVIAETSLAALIIHHDRNEKKVQGGGNGQ